VECGLDIFYPKKLRLFCKASLHWQDSPPTMKIFSSGGQLQLVGFFQIFIEWPAEGW